MIFLVVRKYVLNYHVMSNIIATKCADVTVVLVLAEEFLLSAAVVTIYSSKGISAFPHGPIHGCPSYWFNRRFFLRKPAQRFPNQPFNVFHASEYPNLYRVQSVWQESLYDLWCRKSTFAVLYPSSYGPVAYACDITTVNGAKTNTSIGTSKNNVGFIWDRATPNTLAWTP